MQRTTLLIAAGAMALAPSITIAAPGHSQGSTRGTGWNHQNGPDTTGQPGVECGDDGATSIPGHSASAPGSPFNEDGKAGSVYAGEQPQNSRNSASISQYDAACQDKPN